MKIFNEHIMIETKLFSDDINMFCRLTKCLMLNILIIIKIVSEDYNYIMMNLSQIDNQFLHKLAIDNFK